MPEPVILGGTYTWYEQFNQNTVLTPLIFGIWNLGSPSTAVITLTFISPAGVKKTLTAAIVVAASGTASVTNAASHFDEEGDWQYAWKVVQGAVVLEGLPRIVTVGPSLSAA